MQDIFKSNVRIGDGWKLDGAIINFGPDNNDKLLATSLTIDYSRQTQQINPINEDARYVIASDPTGTIQIGAVVGPSKKLSEFIGQFGDICKLKENEITISPTGQETCDNDWAAEDWKASGCLITGLRMSIEKTAGGNMVIANMNISFLKLELVKASSNDDGANNELVDAGQDFGGGAAGVV